MTVGLGLAWLWPRPGLSTYIYNFAIFDCEINTNTFNYLLYSIDTLPYLFLSAESHKLVVDHAEGRQSGGFDHD
jgi:hypothetical protein